MVDIDGDVDEGTYWSFTVYFKDGCLILNKAQPKYRKKALPRRPSGIKTICPLAASAAAACASAAAACASAAAACACAACASAAACAFASSVFLT